MNYQAKDFTALMPVALEAIEDNPELRDEIIDLVGLAVDEANNGESFENEQELAIGSISELVEDWNGDEDDEDGMDFKAVSPNAALPVHHFKAVSYLAAAAWIEKNLKKSAEYMAVKRSK